MIEMPFSRALVGSLLVSTLVYLSLSFFTPKPKDDEDEEDTSSSKSIHQKAVENKMTISLAIGALVLFLNFSACKSKTSSIDNSI